MSFRSLEVGFAQNCLSFIQPLNGSVQLEFIGFVEFGAVGHSAFFHEEHVSGVESDLLNVCNSSVCQFDQLQTFANVLELSSRY